MFGLLNGVTVRLFRPLVKYCSAQLPELFYCHLLCLMGVDSCRDFLFKPIHQLAELFSHQRIGAQLLEQLGFVVRDESVLVVVSVVFLHAYQP